MQLPKARTADILEQEAASELMIYDLRIDKAYLLNETLKIVYKSCGNLSFDDLRRKYKLTDDLIYLALAELQKSNLLETATDDYFAGMTRREAVCRAGFGTLLALPLIAGIAVPPAARAASSSACAATGQSCRYDNSRQSNCCSSTQRCYEGTGVCRDCLSPNSAYYPAFTPTVAYCNARVEKNLCCVSRGNASVRPGQGLSLDECVCPLPL